MECTENQEDMDKKTENVEKEKPDKKVSESEHECLVKEESLPLFAANDNMEQCDLSANLDFNISRSSEISKENENQSAVHPPEDIVDCVASSSSASNANSDKKEASLQKSSDQEPKKWYIDPESSDENDFSNEDFENFDFNEEDLMDEENLNEEDLMDEENLNEEEEVPRERNNNVSIVVVDLTSDTEDSRETVAADVNCPESDAQASGLDPEALEPVNLCLEDQVENIESPAAPLPAVDVHQIIPMISISDEENEENANMAGELPAEAEKAVAKSGKKHPHEEDQADTKKMKKDDPDAPNEL